MTSKERAALKAKAHSLEPSTFVGKGGVSEGFLQNLDEQLQAKELLKVKFNEFKSEKKQLLLEIAEKTGAELIGRIGNVGILYRERIEDEV